MCSFRSVLIRSMIAGERRRLARARRPGHQDQAARLLGELGHDRRQAQLLEGLDLEGNRAEGAGHVAALHEDVAAEARELLDAEREIELVRLLEAVLLGVGQHRVAELLRLRRRERRHLERMQLAVDPELRRRARRDVKVARALLDHRLQQLMHVRHRRIPPSESAAETRKTSLERRDAFSELVERALPQRDHAAADRLALELERRGAVQHEFLELFRQLHDLVDRDPALEARVRAVAAARPFTGDVACLLLVIPASTSSSVDLRIRLLALLADPARQTLGDDAVDRGGDQEGLDAHVEQTVDRRGRVVGVQGREHHVAGERGLDGDLRGLEVANLTDHDDVGVLTQEGAQRRGEVQADVLVHLDLVDAAEVELDGILGGGEVLADLVELRERRVERGRLTRTGGPGDQHHAEGLVDRLLEVVELRLLEAELGHVELQVRLVEETQHDLLAEERRQDGDAEVHLAAPPDLQLDAAVLGQAALGDVELRHDLDARGDRVLELHRRLHDLVEHAVDAVADAERLLVGLDVDVRRVFLIASVRIRFTSLTTGASSDSFASSLRRRRRRPGRRRCPSRRSRPSRRRGRRLVVVRVDRALDRVFGRDDRLDVVAGEELDVVEREDVRRIGGREDQRRARAVDRHDRVLDRDLFRDQLRSPRDRSRSRRD